MIRICLRDHLKQMLPVVIFIDGTEKLIDIVEIRIRRDIAAGRDDKVPVFAAFLEEPADLQVDLLRRPVVERVRGTDISEDQRIFRETLQHQLHIRALAEMECSAAGFLKLRDQLIDRTSAIVIDYHKLVACDLISDPFHICAGKLAHQRR